jgi:hypothetical protein
MEGKTLSPAGMEAQEVEPHRVADNLEELGHQARVTTEVTYRP